MAGRVLFIFSEEAAARSVRIGRKMVWTDTVVALVVEGWTKQTQRKTKHTGEANEKRSFGDKTKRLTIKVSTRGGVAWRARGMMEGKGTRSEE